MAPVNAIKIPTAWIPASRTSFCAFKRVTLFGTSLGDT